MRTTFEKLSFNVLNLLTVSVSERSALDGAGLSSVTHPWTGHFGWVPSLISYEAKLAKAPPGGISSRAGVSPAVQ